MKNKLKLGLTALVGAGMLAVAGCKHTAPDTSGEQQPVEETQNHIADFMQSVKVIAEDHVAKPDTYFDCGSGVFYNTDEGALGFYRFNHIDEGVEPFPGFQESAEDLRRFDCLMGELIELYEVSAAVIMTEDGAYAIDHQTLKDFTLRNADSIGSDYNLRSEITPELASLVRAAAESDDHQTFEPIVGATTGELEEANKQTYGGVLNLVNQKLSSAIDEVRNIQERYGASSAELDAERFLSETEDFLDLLESVSQGQYNVLDDAFSSGLSCEDHEEYKPLISEMKGVFQSAYDGIVDLQELIPNSNVNNDAYQTFLSQYKTFGNEINALKPAMNEKSIRCMIEAEAN